METRLTLYSSLILPVLDYCDITRRKNDIHLPSVKTNWGKQCFSYQAIKEWNDMDLNIRNSENVFKFRNNCK